MNRCLLGSMWNVSIEDEPQSAQGLLSACCSLIAEYRKLYRCANIFGPCPRRFCCWYFCPRFKATLVHFVHVGEECSSRCGKNQNYGRNGSMGRRSSMEKVYTGVCRSSLSYFTECGLPLSDDYGVKRTWPRLIQVQVCITIVRFGGINKEWECVPCRATYINQWTSRSWVKGWVISATSAIRYRFYSSRL